MAFSFGGATAAAPTGGFGAAPTPAFGAAPAPAFGASPAAFGAAPAPAFGAAPAPAFGAAPGGFGAAPAPAFGAAPASTGVFGAPASSAFGAPPASTFGAPPAPTYGGFGATPSAPAFGAPAAPAFGGPAPGTFGANPQQQQIQQHQMQPPVAISGGTPYSQLPQDLKHAIDTIHEAMMRHKKTMINLQSMAPALLLGSSKDPSKIGIPATGQQHPVPLSVTIRGLHQKIASLEQETGLQTRVDSCKDDYEKLIKQAVMFGRWQIEALAVRRGVHLQPISTEQQQQSATDNGTANGQSSAKAQLQAVLDRQMAHVDRLERMPSPYLWQVLEDMEKRLGDLKHHAWTVEQQLASSIRSNEPADIVSIVQSQHRALHKVSTILSNLHAQVEGLRQQYRFYEKGENVLEKANYEEKERERRLNDRIRMEYVKAAANAVPSNTGQPALGQAPAPGGFGAPSPALAFGGFGPAAPAPAAGFGFGSPTPAPAAGASTFSFSGPTAAAPGVGAATSAFGAAPAFGAALAFGAVPAFGAAPAAGSTPKKNSKTRNKNRLGR